MASKTPRKPNQQGTPPPAGTGGREGVQGRIIGSQSTRVGKPPLSPSSLQKRLDSLAAGARTLVGPRSSEGALRGPLPPGAAVGRPAAKPGKRSGKGR